jgi:hypothetical protein
MNAQVSPGSVKRLLESGIEPDRIAQLLVATGVWSESGASDIISTMARANRPASAVKVGTQAGLSTMGQRDTALGRD